MKERIDSIIEQVKDIVLSPKQALLSIRKEEMPIATTVRRYIAVLACVPALGQFIGKAIIGYGPPVFRLDLGRSFLSALLFYVFIIIVVVAYGRILSLVAPYFGANKNADNSFKLSVASFTPTFVMGAFYLVPNLEGVVLFGYLYGIYILYLGLSILMDTPEENLASFTVVSVLIAMLMLIVVFGIANSVWSSVRFE